MEYVIHLLALFIALNFLLKVGFYPRWGMWTVAAGCAFFAWLVTPWMTEQSKTVVAAFFASRPQMLNLSVCVTLEAAVMITFCFDCFAEMRTRNTAFKTSGHPLPEVIPRHTDRRSNMLCPGTAAFHFSRNRFRQSLMDSSRCYFLCSLCWEPSAAACYR
mgnify:CR=1 FL=1